MNGQAKKTGTGIPRFDALEPRVLLSGDPALLGGAEALAPAGEPCVGVTAEPTQGQTADVLGAQQITRSSETLDRTLRDGPNGDLAWWMIEDNAVWQMGSLQWVSFDHAWDGPEDVEVARNYDAVVTLDTYNVWGEHIDDHILYDQPLFNDWRDPDYFKGFACYICCQDGRSQGQKDAHEAWMATQHPDGGIFCGADYSYGTDLGFLPGWAKFTLTVEDANYNYIDLDPETAGNQFEITAWVQIVNPTDLRFSASAGLDQTSIGRDYYFEWTGSDYDHVVLNAHGQDGNDHCIFDSDSARGFAMDSQGWICWTGDTSGTFVLDPTNLPRGFHWKVGDRYDPAELSPLKLGTYSVRAYVDNSNDTYGGYTYGVDWPRTVELVLTPLWGWSIQRALAPDLAGRYPQFQTSANYIGTGGSIAGGFTAETTASTGQDEVVGESRTGLLDAQTEPTVSGDPVAGTASASVAPTAEAGLGENLVDVLAGSSRLL